MPKEKKSAIPFPCNFTIKIIGKAEKAFEKAVLAIIKTHYPDFNSKTYKKRLSRDGNYLAITITVYAKNKSELDALYQSLSHCEKVIMAL